MKAVLMSIQPKWCELIASGKKTVEVRKTRPKLEVPFKVYIYCTNTKPYLVWGDVFRGNWETEVTHLSGYNRAEAEKIWDVFNGKVIGEFVCDSMTSLKADNMIQAYYNNTKETCLTDEEIKQYANNGKLFYWHISNLVIYDKPRELGEFFLACDKPNGTDCSVCLDRRENRCKVITRPPQSWCYVERSESDGQK